MVFVYISVSTASPFAQKPDYRQTHAHTQTHWNRKQKAMPPAQAMARMKRIMPFPQKNEQCKQKKCQLVNMCALECKAQPSKHLVSTNTEADGRLYDSVTSIPREYVYCPGSYIISCSICECTDLYGCWATKKQNSKTLATCMEITPFVDSFISDAYHSQTSNQVAVQPCLQSIELCSHRTCVCPLPIVFLHHHDIM